MGVGAANPIVWVQVAGASKVARAFLDCRDKAARGTALARRCCRWAAKAHSVGRRREIGEARVEKAARVTRCFGWRASQERHKQECEAKSHGHARQDSSRSLALWAAKTKAPRVIWALSGSRCAGDQVEEPEEPEPPEGVLGALGAAAGALGVDALPDDPELLAAEPGGLL